MEQICEVDNGSKRKYFLNYFGIILLIDIAIIFFLYIWFDSTPKELFKTGIILFLYTSIFYLIPLIILYLNYLKRNRNERLLITKKGDNLNEIRIKSNKLDLVFFNTDIKKIEAHLSYPLYDKRMRWFFWDELYYIEIILKNSKRIIITCFLCDNFLVHFPNMKINRIKRFFPIIKAKK